MAISRERKEELVEQYVENLQAGQGIILTDYRGLQVTEMEQLRRSLREQDVTLRVVKNRLFHLALGQIDLEVPEDWLEGPTAVAFCRGDMPPAAKVLDEFAKDWDVFVIKGGLLEGTVMSAEKVGVLAKLPTRDVLLGHVLGTINAPASQVSGVVASGIRQVLNVLKAYVDELEGESPAPQAA